MAAIPPLASTALCTEEEISALVHGFYARVRADAELGPIFDEHIADWDRHLALLCDFWSSVLLRTGRFRGAPMPKHAALPDLRAQLFQRWLALFAKTAHAHPNQQMARQAVAMAERIAQSLWMGWQTSRHPDRIPSPLPLAGQQGKR